MRYLLHYPKKAPPPWRRTYHHSHAPDWSNPLWRRRKPLSDTIAPLRGAEDFHLRHVRFPDATTSLLLLTDLHWNGRQVKRYSKFADAIRQLRYDWLLFGGDLAVYPNRMEGALAWLSDLHPVKGTYTVLGNRESRLTWLNHDYWHGAFTAHGMRCLINESVTLQDNLMLFGLDDSRFGYPDWSPLKTARRPGQTVLTLCHNPDGAGASPVTQDIGDLVLCGHTHGGQICLPFLGPLYTSSHYGRQFAHGWQERSDGTLLLTIAGVGESGFGLFHRRLFCPPELLLLEI
ncbi:MAG: metallophosphoesterase [Victivallales bacterium]|nr:metallophosphoesterase [Victivallales bacterium]